MSKIRILPEILTNKIAAGEVVERPGSVVKELLENSLDAGADRISVEVGEGGKSLIRVSDNGSGMGRDDALLCLERHATSKISTDDDLFEIRTLGFRGEALPSIASVSSLTLVSRSAESESATIIRVEGGKILDVSETGAPVGTSVTVSRLFHNVPARKKFLKTAATELGHVSETITSAALCRPGVSFSLSHNGREIFSWPAVRDLAARAHAVLGHETGPSLVPVGLAAPAAEVCGLVAPEEVSRSTTRGLYVFVNGRVVADRLLIRAVMDGFSGRLTKGRYPVALVSVEVPCSEVDVNVHPAKAQVRFARPGEVHAAVVRAVKTALLESAGARAPWGKPSAPVSAAADPPGSLAAPPGKNAGEPARRGFPGHFQKPESASAAAAIARDLGFGKLSASQRFPAQTAGPGETAAKFRPPGDKGDTTPAPMAPPPAPGPSQVAEPGAAFGPENFSRRPAFPPPEPAHPEPRPAPEVRKPQEALFPQKPSESAGFKVIGQMRSSFIVCESSRGLVLIDQHAAHERVMFEKLRARFLSGRIEAMDLLFPETVTLSHSEADALTGLVPEISRLGLEIEPFSGNAFVVKAAPSFLGGRPLAGLVRQLAEQALEMESSNDLARIMDECVALTACHGSVRANQALSDEEMKRLVADLSACADPAHCPHGRPTWTTWTVDEIYKDFKRK